MTNVSIVDYNVSIVPSTMDTSKSIMDTSVMVQRLWSLVQSLCTKAEVFILRPGRTKSLYHYKTNFVGTKRSDVNPIKNFVLWSKAKSLLFVQCINGLRCKKIHLGYLIVSSLEQKPPTCVHSGVCVHQLTCLIGHRLIKLKVWWSCVKNKYLHFD